MHLILHYSNVVYVSTCIFQYMYASMHAMSRDSYRFINECNGSSRDSYSPLCIVYHCDNVTVRRWDFTYGDLAFVSTSTYIDSHVYLILLYSNDVYVSTCIHLILHYSSTKTSNVLSRSACQPILCIIFLSMSCGHNEVFEWGHTFLEPIQKKSNRYKKKWENVLYHEDNDKRMHHRDQRT